MMGILGFRNRELGLQVELESTNFLGYLIFKLVEFCERSLGLSVRKMAKNTQTSAFYEEVRNRGKIHLERKS